MPRSNRHASNDRTRHHIGRGAELQLDLEDSGDAEWVTDMFWKMEGTLSLRDFINLAISEMTPGRRYGYVRLFLYPTKKAFFENGGKCCAIFIRKLNTYVVGVQRFLMNIQGIGRVAFVPGNIHEIGRDCEYETKRYFFNTTPTGFGQEYGELFEGTGINGDLVGVWIGFHVLNQAILRVIRKAEPSEWAWSIGVFALTFSECIRFVWSQRTTTNLIGDRTDTRMDGEYKYMAKIPKEWRNISKCARRNVELGEAQPDGEKYTMEGLENLKIFTRYAIESLNTMLWCNDDNNRRVHEQLGGGQRVASAFGDGGGGYF